MTPDAITESVQKLFLQHSAALRGYILGLMHHRDAAEDLFQELFLTITRLAPQFRPEGSFLAWARGVARIKVLEYYRKTRTSPQPFDENLIELLATSAEEQGDLWEERREALSACIQKLAPRARQILELRYADTPVSPSEIAERLTWTANAVNVALARARKFLLDCANRRLRLGGS